MEILNNKSLSEVWLEVFGQDPIHERHQGSQGFANWVGLYASLINQIVIPEHKNDNLVIVDGLPGKNSPKVAEAARMLRHSHMYDKPIHLHGLDGDMATIDELNELLKQWNDVFNFFPFHALLTPHGVVSFQDKPMADATIINHGIDDAALYELSRGEITCYEADVYTHKHADYMVRLIGDAADQSIHDAQERAAKSILQGVIELTKNGGMVFVTHYNTVNWTRYEEFEPGYFDLISGFAQGAFDLVKEMAKITKTLDIETVIVNDFKLSDSQNIKIKGDENMFNRSNLLVLRKD